MENLLLNSDFRNKSITIDLSKTNIILDKNNELIFNKNTTLFLNNFNNKVNKVFHLENSKFYFLGNECNINSDLFFNINGVIYINNVKHYNYLSFEDFGLYYLSLKYFDFLNSKYGNSINNTRLLLKNLVSNINSEVEKENLLKIIFRFDKCYKHINFNNFINSLDDFYINYVYHILKQHLLV